jgi:TPR repeat protein
LAAEQSDANAQLALGRLYENGLGLEQDEREAARLYLLAADQGHSGAQSRLAGLYYDGRGVEQDDATAASWFDRAAAQDHAPAQYNLGLMYLQGRGPQHVTAIDGVMWITVAMQNPTATEELVEACRQSRARALQSMTAADIAEAERLAASWIAEYRNADTPQ